jgi:hypothetical protein
LDIGRLSLQGSLTMLLGAVEQLELKQGEALLELKRLRVMI